jgi:hypothetical protein
MRTQAGNSAVHQNRPGKTFGDNKRIVAQRFKEFAQHLRPFAMLRHAVHLGL